MQVRGNVLISIKLHKKLNPEITARNQKCCDLFKDYTSLEESKRFYNIYLVPTVVSKRKLIEVAHF